MDGKERLRRYLEQRRELGETELVLDGLPVDEVMALLTARPGAPRARAARTDLPSSTTDAHADGDAGTEAASAGSAARDASAEPIDDPRDPAAEERVLPSVPREPERRFDGSSSSTDWREMLRRAGAMKPAADEAAPTASAPLWLETLGVPLGIATGEATSRVSAPEIGALHTLEALAELVRACTRCDLYKTALNPVPGEGSPDADFVCVGEAPGQNEDEQGRPFVGASGALLNKILGAIGLQRDEVFICNVLKHRPPGNRDPLPSEVEACDAYLRRQLELLQPRVILALGRFAAQSLLQTTEPISKLRGQVHRYHGVPLVVTYHPSALLRNEAWKRPTWDDVKLARRILDASRAASPS